MTAALRYEWRRLWSIRSTYWLIGITLVLQLVATLLAALGTSAVEDVFDATETVSQIITLGAATGLSPLFTAYIIAMFGVFCFGHEYRYGMIRATLTAVPDRRAVFAAKALITALLAAAMSVSCCLIGMFSSLLFLDTRGALGSDTIWYVVLGSSIYTTLFGLCGMAFAALVRNQTGALAMILLIPLVAENIISLILRIVSQDGGDAVELAKVLPFDAGAQMYASSFADELNRFLGYDPLGALGGGLVFAGFTALMMCGAFWLFLARDA
ncbi:MAG: hypothetical protein M3419_10700 [Actinomycetota bacterium]|nr:hypothetical protein [Actinomycetota bacterium]